MRHFVLPFCLWSIFISATSMAQDESKKQQKPLKLPFRISKETTYITEPLTDCGLVNYAAYLNQKLSQGVTPENNAAVLYWKAIGDQTEDDNPVLDVILNADREFFKMLKEELGTDPFEEGGPYLSSASDVLEDGDSFELLTEELNGAQSTPWKPSQFPLMKKWLEQNENPLQIVIAGTQREKYFEPLILTNEDEGLLSLQLGASLASSQQYRNLARMFEMRAMLALGEHRPEDAVRDLLALHRLARHAGQGPTIIRMFVGWALEPIAVWGDQQLVNSPDVTVRQLLTYQQALERMPKLVSARQIYQRERLDSLDILQHLTVPDSDGSISDKFDEYFGIDIYEGETGDLWARLLVYGVDWNRILIETNRYYDELDAAFSQKSYSARYKAVQNVISSYNKQRKKLATKENRKQIASMTPEERGRQMSVILQDLLSTVSVDIVDADAHKVTGHQLVLIGLGIAAYQKSTGKFPESLDALVPGYLPKLPNDPYTGKPFTYRIDDEGAIVYSLGGNLKDDDGSTRETDDENYDLVFRVKRIESK